jgi:hypothetical protein
MSDLLRRYHAYTAWLEEEVLPDTPRQEILTWTDYEERCGKLQRIIDQLAEEAP